MSLVQEIESAIQGLSAEQKRQIRDWIDELLENEMEFTDEFKTKIQRAKRHIAQGRGRVVKP